MKRIILTICAFGALASCLFAQQKFLFNQTSTPDKTAVPVIVTNRAGEPVPVTVVPDPAGGTMLTVAENDTSIASVYFVDLRKYRYFTVFGTGYGQANLSFVDEPTTPNVRSFIGICGAHEPLGTGLAGGWHCSTGSGVASRIEVGGPFLEISAMPESAVGMGTVKIYLHK